MRYARINAEKKFLARISLRAFRAVRASGQRELHNFRLKIVYGLNALFKKWRPAVIETGCS